MCNAVVGYEFDEIASLDDDCVDPTDFKNPEYTGHLVRHRVPLFRTIVCVEVDTPIYT